MPENDGWNVTIDKLEDIFAQTLGSVRGSAGMVLWCWVTQSSMSMDVLDQSPLTYMSIAWCLGVLIVRLAMYANRKLVDGTSKYELVPERDLIVVTGGSSGLGLLLLAMFSADGFQTVNLDVKQPLIPVANSQYHECDICDASAIKDAITGLFAQEVVPSVLINCAGIVSGTLGPLTELDQADVVRTLDTNLKGTILVTKHVLNQRKPMKMIASISSSTSLVGPAYAGIYAASKAGVRVFMDSLRHELRGTPTRVLSVLPGQLDTEMFANVSTPSPFWAPIVKVSDAAADIHDAILRGRQGEIAMPTYSRLLPYILLLPSGLTDILRRYIGVDQAASSVNT